jgi:hypothetical protein
MVEANTEIINKLTSVLIEEIKNISRVSEEKTARKIEIFEELKLKLKPKIVVVKRELAHMTNTLK